MNDKGILLESGTNEMELLTVFVDGQAFGMNVAKIQSIQQYNPELVTAMPEAQPEILGMLLYRNKTIPLMDLAQILGLTDSDKHQLDKSSSENTNERNIIVVTEFNNSVNSFKVQDVNRIFRLSWKDFVPLDNMFKDNSFFTGSVNVEKSQILILDLEYILANIFPDLVLEDVAEEIFIKKEHVSREQLEIIFAEDSPIIRKGVIKALKKAGFKNISDFINGDIALKHIKKRLAEEKNWATQNVVLITDIEMPKMDGLTLCKQIKSNPSLEAIYVVMFSSLINSQMIAKCKKVNAQNYVTKPEINRLITVLDQRCEA